MAMKSTIKKSSSIAITAMSLQSFVLMFVSNVGSLGSMVLHAKRWQYCLLPYSQLTMELMFWETLGVMCYAAEACYARVQECAEHL